MALRELKKRLHKDVINECHNSAFSPSDIEMMRIPEVDLAMILSAKEKPKEKL